jgi:hypothetical protein
MLSVARVPRVGIPGWTPEAISWEDLVPQLMTHDIRPEKDGPLWSPVSVQDSASRTNAAVEAVHLLVLDFDCGKGVSEIDGPLEGLEMVIHSSHSHHDDHPKFRVVIPLASPVPAARWKSWWSSFVKTHAPDCDPACKNASRVYFLPSCPEETFLEAFSEHRPGRWLEPALWLVEEKKAEAPVETRSDARPTGKGDYKTLEVHAWAVAKNLNARLEEGGEGKTFIDCPWKSGHTDGAQGPRDTYLLNKQDGGKPVFKCSHSHCSGKGFWQVMEAVGDADRFCASDYKTTAPAARKKEPSPAITNWEEIDEVFTGDIPWNPVRIVPEKVNQQTGEVRPEYKFPIPCDANAATYLQHAFPGKIRYNELTLQIEINGLPVEDSRVASLAIQLQRLTGQAFLVKHLQTALLSISQDHSIARYHPIRQYLDSLKWDGQERIESLFEAGILGVSAEDENEDLYRAYLKAWFVAAVARQMRPGCKMDTALVLQGAQGLGKSSFFRALLPEDRWFCDSMASLDKDARLQLVRSWIFEWSELESVRRTEAGQVKAFLSAQDDDVRPPYAREHVRRSRSCIIVGTTNDEQFLSDTTGSRRYWVIPVQSIDKDEVERLRDHLWAEALHLYRQGEKWWLSKELEARQQKNNETYLTLGPWEGAISDWLSNVANIEPFDGGGWQTTTGNILTHCLGKPKHQQNIADQMKVSLTMTSLGWVKRRIRDKESRIYLWWKSER